MSKDTLSKAFTTTRALELEYRKLTMLRESGSEIELSARIDEDGDRALLKVIREGSGEFS